MPDIGAKPIAPRLSNTKTTEAVTPCAQPRSTAFDQGVRAISGLAAMVVLRRRSRRRMLALVVRCPLRPPLQAFIVSRVQPLGPQAKPSAKCRARNRSHSNWLFWRIATL